MDWADVWQILANISKTSVFHIGTSDNVEYNLNNCVLSSVSVRDLGILIHFSQHVFDFGKHLQLGVLR